MKKYLNREFLKDLADRTLSTYVQTFLGLELSNIANLTDIGATKVAALASLPAALAVVKAAIKAKAESKGA